MNEQDKEEFEKWYFEVPYKVDYHASPDQLEEAWQAALEYKEKQYQEKESWFQACRQLNGVYQHELEAERARSQKLFEALEKIAAQCPSLEQNKSLLHTPADSVLFAQASVYRMEIAIQSLAEYSREKR